MNKSYIDKFVAHIINRCERSQFTAFPQDSSTEPPHYCDGLVPASGKYICLQRDYCDRIYSWFTPAKETGKPLIVLLPGYDSAIYQTPDLSKEYNVLYISPLGYFTPEGINTSKYKHRNMPVLYNTVHGLRDDYNEWILDVLVAIKYVETEHLTQNVPLIFAGTSQGGGMSLILGSILKDRVKAICADLPWLIGFSVRRLQDVIYSMSTGFEAINTNQIAERLSVIDPINHTHRLTMPKFITASNIDDDCPCENIKDFFDDLPAPKDFTAIDHLQNNSKKCYSSSKANTILNKCLLNSKTRRISVKNLDKYRGCLIGGAIGDALGYTVEFLEDATIFSLYGENGITEYSLQNVVAEISDDTQMTLFTAVGLIIGTAIGKTHEIPGTYPRYINFCYRDWYKTQTAHYPLPEKRLLFVACELT